MSAARFFWLGLWPSLAVAGGFSLPVPSTRALGLAGAGVGEPGGASAAYLAPSALAFEDGYAAELVLHGLTSALRAQPQGGDGRTFASRSSLSVAPAVFLEAPVAERWAVGLGAFSNFGFQLAWPSDFDGRFEGQRLALSTYTVNPSAAYRVSDELAVGAGVDLVRGTVELEQALDFLDAEGRLRLGGGAWGVGVNLSASGRFLRERLGVGLFWRSMVELPFAGRAHFDVPVEFAGDLRDQEIRSRLRLPHQLGVGASYRALPWLRVAADLSYTGWSSFDALELDFLEDDALDQRLRRAWRDALAVRAGAEFALSRAVDVRVGAGFDPSPAPADTLSPLAPDLDRVYGSVGAGYRLGNFRVDAAYLFAWLRPRASAGEAFAARYFGVAHVASLSVGFRQ